MSTNLKFEEAIRLAGLKVSPPLIAIDGLPCAGKSTLSTRLLKHLGFECICLDEFVLAESDWPSKDRPAFPFEFIRYNSFLNAITTLASTGKCTYAPFDWKSLSVSKQERTVKLSQPVIIEGVSALHPDLCDLYGLKFFVLSDRSTTLSAAAARGMGNWAREWQDLILPSVDIYMLGRPERRADYLVDGRGKS